MENRCMTCGGGGIVIATSGFFKGCKVTCMKCNGKGQLNPVQEISKDVCEVIEIELTTVNLKLKMLLLVKECTIQEPHIRSVLEHFLEVHNIYYTCDYDTGLIKLV